MVAFEKKRASLPPLHKTGLQNIVLPLQPKQIPSTVDPAINRSSCMHETISSSPAVHDDDPLEIFFSSSDEEKIEICDAIPPPIVPQKRKKLVSRPVQVFQNGYLGTFIF